MGGKGKDTLRSVPVATVSTLLASMATTHLSFISVGSSSFVATGGKGFDSIRLGSATFATVAGGGLADTINFTSTNSGGGVFYGDALGVTTVGTGTGGQPMAPISSWRQR